MATHPKVPHSNTNPKRKSKQGTEQQLVLQREKKNGIKARKRSHEMDRGFDVLKHGGAALVLLGIVAVESTDVLRLHIPAPYPRRVHLVGETPILPYAAFASSDHACPCETPRGEGKSRYRKPQTPTTDWMLIYFVRLRCLFS